MRGRWWWNGGAAAAPPLTSTAASPSVIVSTLLSAGLTSELVVADVSVVRLAAADRKLALMLAVDGGVCALSVASAMKSDQGGARLSERAVHHVALRPSRHHRRPPSGAGCLRPQQSQHANY